MKRRDFIGTLAALPIVGRLLVDQVKADPQPDPGSAPDRKIPIEQHGISHTHSLYPSAPGSPAPGDVWYNTTDGKIYIWDGYIWAKLPDGWEPLELL